MGSHKKNNYGICWSPNKIRVLLAPKTKGDNNFVQNSNFLAINHAQNGVEYEKLILVGSKTLRSW